jgi:hypothetical protein
LLKFLKAAIVPLLVLGNLMVPSESSAVGTYNNAAIADKALTYVGQWGGNACNDAQKPGDSGGQCRAFVNCIVWMTSNHTQALGGSDYFSDFAREGSQEITEISALAKGDIVQVGQGDHTFIIVSKVSGSTFSVVDSNHDFSETVMNYNRTVSLDSNTRAFRMGAIDGLVGNAGTLWFIKTKNTGSGHVEVHSATPGSGYQSGQHSATWFLTAEANNGWFQVAGSNLWFIKTKYTGSGRVEVHSATGASGYQSGVHYASLFSSGEADNGWFQMDDWNRDGVQDLIYIKTRNTGSGRVEIFAADGASGYGRLLVAAPTSFSPGDANNGWFQEQNRDLVFIKTRNTGSGRVEYFRSSASSSFSQLTLATPTVFYPYDQNNGWFSSEDVSGDGRADEMFIKTHNTGSGHVELFEADGASNYQQLTQAIVTWLSPADADNGWFQVNSKQ